MSLNLVIYQAVIIPAEEKSDDIIGPLRVVLTKETNGFALWKDERGRPTLITYMLASTEHSEAIERAVEFANGERQHHKNPAVAYG